jgi:hypothetical protein
MRKTVIVLLSAAFVAALPSLASAKSKKVRHVAPPPAAQSNGGKFVADALYQFIVPLQQTFTPRPVVEKKVRVRHAAKRRVKTS